MKNDLRSITPNRNITSGLVYEKIRMLAVANKSQYFGNDRGGAIEFLSTKARSLPCVIPFRVFAIAYAGKVRMH